MKANHNENGERKYRAKDEEALGGQAGDRVNISGIRRPLESPQRNDGTNAEFLGDLVPSLSPAHD